METAPAAAAAAPAAGPTDVAEAPAETAPAAADAPTAPARAPARTSALRAATGREKRMRSPGKGRARSDSRQHAGSAVPPWRVPEGNGMNNCQPGRHPGFGSP